MTRRTTIFGWLLTGALATGIAGGAGMEEECYYCPQDINLDGMIDQQDVGLVLEHWGCFDGQRSVADRLPGVVIRDGRPAAGPCTGDCDTDGDVDVMDLVEVIMAWGACGP